MAIHRISILKPAALAVCVSAVLAGCASSSKGRIVETEDGKVAAIGTAKNESDAIIAAVDQAEKHCAENEKKAVFKKDFSDSRSDDSSKGPRLNLEKLPVIGKAFSEDNPKVVLPFSCKRSG